MDVDTPSVTVEKPDEMPSAAETNTNNVAENMPPPISDAQAEEVSSIVPPKPTGPVSPVTPSVVPPEPTNTNNVAENLPPSISGAQVEEVSSVVLQDPSSPVGPVSPSVVPPEPTVSPVSPVSPSVVPPEPTVSPVSPEAPSTPRTCVNFLCKAGQTTNFVPAYSFVLNHFNVPAKTGGVVQYVCTECHDAVLQQFGQLCAAYAEQQPLIVQPMPTQPDLVDLIDSSDEEDAEDKPIAQQPFAADVLTMLEQELESTLGEAFDHVNFTNQLKWTQQSFQQRIAHNAEQSDAMWKEMRELQVFADRMHSSLYRTVSHVTKELPPWDDATKTYGPDYPCSGPIEYPPVNTSDVYYAVRYKAMNAWVECSVLEVLEPTTSTGRCYKVRFAKAKGVQQKTISGKHLAYGAPPVVRLTIGVRVIALFQQDDIVTSKFYPGIVAEPLQAYNNWRYLIFFDDGYAQYVKPDNVRLVCETSSCVWYDVHADSAAFIQHYLQLYSTERPMVQVRTGQRMATEWQGNWLQARVQAIDASLVQMMFEEGKRLEWIYRGSTRLSPLFFNKLNKHTGGMARRNEPYVNYMSNVNYQSASQQSKSAAAAKSSVASGPASEIVAPPPVKTEATGSPVTRRSNTAKKSTTASPGQTAAAAPAQRATPPTRRPIVQHMNNSTIYVDACTTGKTVYYTAKRHMPPRRYEPHTCNPGCLFVMTNDLRTYSPLSKPLLSGWERPISKVKTKKQVGYRAPCGRRLRNMTELHRYLTMTQCELSIDNFDFDIDINCLAEYVLESTNVQIADLSNKLENMAVACVNHHDSTLPPPCTYSAVRIENEGVTINTSDDFLCGCDCEDDCLDKSKCQCWQLTLDGARFANPDVDPETVGYKFKRLPDAVATGIYECNSRCKCKSTCLNRVAQQPLKLKLQVYKTDNRGWGLRCLNDMPKGCFVCVYAGDLLTEQCANEAGDNFGDEYFAELDYIEVVEALKAGYEPDVVNDPEFDKDDDDDEQQREEEADDSDDKEFVAKQQQLTNMNARQTRYNTRTRRPKGGDETAAAKKAAAAKSTTTTATNANDEDDDDDDEANERQPISFEPNANSQRLGDEHSPKKLRSVRQFYGENESVYIMDAKKTGNIGRYFNHSCNPNLFVQNVFVDTHDLRFPWVAFYAVRFIPNGEELTWNYNYDVGSVPGKVLFCECRAPNCRGRLL